MPRPIRRLVVLVALAAAAAAAAPAGASAVAGPPVPLPELGVAHRYGVGINLWQVPLSDLEAGAGEPVLVRTLLQGGWTYAASRTLPADLGDVTAGDDGTADFVVAHEQSGGGLLLWAVGGGSDPTPEVWAELRTGGWSFRDSRQLAGDVNGDGLDDVVSVHRVAGASNNIWVHRNTGSGFAPPELWLQRGLWAFAGQQANREVLADLDGDGDDDLVLLGGWVPPSGTGLFLQAFPSTGAAFGPEVAQRTLVAGGWSFQQSRQVGADVDGDGRDEIVHTHAAGNGPGLLVWVQRAALPAPGGFGTFEEPQLWSELRAGGWSYVGSRQYAGDLDADGREDLVSVHDQGAGQLVWRHRSTGAGFAAPDVVGDLRAGGWSFHNSRDGVADVWGFLE